MGLLKMPTSAQRVDSAWAVRAVEAACPGAKWVKLHSVGDTRLTVKVRFLDRSESDKQVQDREVFLAGIHPAIWQVRLSSRRGNGESYDIVFSHPRQTSF